jgi:CelD/BcsL family acetyltransferase involved in cellulose biosynthesis
MHSGAIRVEVVQDEAGLMALETPWRALERRATPFGPAQTFAWARFASQAMPKQDGLKLAVIAVWRGMELVCVWPLSTQRHGRTAMPSHHVTHVRALLHRGVTVATHLGTGCNEEYSGPLLLEDEGAPAAAEAAEAAIRAAKRHADVIQAHHLPPQSAMARALALDPALKFRSSMSSPVVALAGHSDWDSWAKEKSGQFRWKLRKDRKRLAKLGTLSATVIAGGAEARALVAWTFAVKRQWVTDRGLRGYNWTRDGFGEAFFSEFFAREGQGDALGFALKLDGQIIAACLCLRSARRLEYFVTSFDPKFSDYAPGNLVIEDCVNWALRAGIDFDFRLTQDHYKMRWADRLDRFDSTTLACSLRGVTMVWAAHGGAAVLTAKRWLGPRVKPVLRAALQTLRGKRA